MAKEVFSKRK